VQKNELPTIESLRRDRLFDVLDKNSLAWRDIFEHIEVSSLNRADKMDDDITDEQAIELLDEIVKASNEGEKHCRLLVEKPPQGSQIYSRANWGTGVKVTLVYRSDPKFVEV